MNSLRPPVLPVLPALTVVVALLTVAGCGSASSGATAPGSTRTAERSASAPAASPTLGPEQIRATAERQVASIIAAQPRGAVSVAALNTATGARFVAGAGSGMWTASAYKLFVVEALLLRREDQGAYLSSYEVDEVSAALQYSDNAAAYRLFLDVGGNAALTETAQRLGMTHTVPGASDPTFTTTSGADYLKLLESLVDPGTLSARARSFVLGLMRNVEADQRWGVSAVADKDSSVALKNGWLSIDNSNGPGETDNGLWVASSAGIVRVEGQQVLMAIFTRHQPDYATGIRLVERLATAIAPAVTAR